jgi:uroporphyrinogen decarboxylase
MLRRHKKHDTTPEHVDFTIKDFAGWREVRNRLTDVDFRRINFEAYRNAKEIARKTNRYFCWSGINVFEAMHPVCGHEHMLVGMATDPGWIEDMVNVYTDLTIALQEELFAREGCPDGMFYYEDMGFKERPFMSPRMYKELIFPAHKRSIDFAHARNLPVIMHSCGFIEPLLPGMVEAGIDCLQVIEVKAGCDLLRIYKDFGEKIALMGGIDVRELYSNDFSRVEAELRKKIPVVKEGFAYCLHSDHSIPNTVNYETLKYFIETGIEMGKY